MRVEFAQISIRHRLLASAVLAVGLAFAAAVSRHPVWELFLLSRPPTCMLKAVTGLPCLACRGTRAAFALAHGQLGMALRYNPLAVLFLSALASYFAVLGIAGRQITARLSRGESILCWTLLGIALIGNWAYVIWRGG